MGVRFSLSAPLSTNNQIDKDNSDKTQNVAKLNLTRFFFLSIIQNMIDIENILRGKAKMKNKIINEGWNG